MAYELITTRALDEGPHIMLCYVNDITNGLFMTLAVLVLFLVLALGMYFAQTRMKGKGDAAVCFAVASYVMIPFIVILSMIPCLVNARIVIEIIIFAGIGTLWLFFSKSNTEPY